MVGVPLIVIKNTTPESTVPKELIVVFPVMFKEFPVARERSTVDAAAISAQAANFACHENFIGVCF